MDNPSSKRAEQEIARIASLTDATAGACAIHVESGQQLHLNAGMPFPMASTYKVPIAITLLRQVDEGAWHWTSVLRSARTTSALVAATSPNICTSQG